MYLTFSIFSDFSLKYKLLPPPPPQKKNTFHGVDLCKHFLVERLYLKLQNNNKIAMYKEETITYLRFSIF